MNNKYEEAYLQSGISPAHKIILTQIRDNFTILDVGCSSGFFAKEIQDRHPSIVDGVEIDSSAAEKAKKYLRDVYVGSIENPEIIKQLIGSGKKYDVIVFADVLEHCVDLDAVLAVAKRMLADNGYILASIPNVANWRVRLNLLLGKFDYEETGLLDRGHLRFLTLKSAEELFVKAGFSVDFLGFTLGAGPKMIKKICKSNKSLLKLVIKKISGTCPGIFSHQFVLKARPN